MHPGKGSAVLFYNLLPDGNGDALALHAAVPVRHGEKWLCNFWVWDSPIVSYSLEDVPPQHTISVGAEDAEESDPREL